MNAKQATEDLQRHFLQEHAEIYELATTLLRVLVEQQQPSTKVSRLLETLCERLRSHFADEEASGMFEQIVRSMPELSSETTALQAEHGELVKGLEHLREQAGRRELSRSVWDELASGFREFSNRLRRHEVQEDELLRQAFEEPEGEED